MDTALFAVLLAAGVVAIGLARLIGHAPTQRILDVLGTVLAGVALVAGIITLH